MSFWDICRVHIPKQLSFNSCHKKFIIITFKLFAIIKNIGASNLSVEYEIPNLDGRVQFPAGAFYEIDKSRWMFGVIQNILSCSIPSDFTNLIIALDCEWGREQAGA